MSAVIQISQSEKSNLIDTEVAEYLNLSVSTIRRWRLIGKGPRWFRIGGSVRYPHKELAEYVSKLPSGGGIREAR